MRSARWAVSAYFWVMGLTGGTWMARIPAAKAQAHLSDGTLGAALFALPAGLMLGAALAERLVDRIGSAPVARAAGVGSCLLLVTPGLTSGLPGLMAALFGFGFAGGALDVAQNAQGVRVEAAYRRPVMTSMHACFSLGAIAGALAGGGLAWAGVTLLPSLAAVGVAGAGIDALAGRWLLPGTRDEAGPRAAFTDQEAAVPRAPHPPRDERRIRRLILAVGFLGVCGMVGEGAAGDWSAVYLRDHLGTSAGFAALGFAAFSVTMTAGRAAGDRLIHRFGLVPVIRAGGVIATAGIAVALLTASPAVVIAGFAVFGAGLSAVVPQAFAAGGRVDPDRPGSGIAKVVGLGYAGLTAGPAVIGALAAAIGLRLALTVPVAAALWIAVGAPALAVPGEAHGAARSDRDRPG